MSTQNRHKLTKFLDRHVPGTVYTAAWLERLGISRDLQKRYRRSHWLESIGPGAYKRPAENVGWQGAVNALQTQAGLAVHVGALTALTLQGLAHYLRMERATLDLFAPPRTILPAWFNRYDWNVFVRFVRSSFLPADVGLRDQEEQGLRLRVSSPERAILECLYLAPEDIDLIECYHIMEGLANLRPRILQELLSVCGSVKAKRLFLYMAEKSGHAWLGRLNQAEIDLGQGHRRLADGGAYVAKYQLTIPAELAAL